MLLIINNATQQGLILLHVYLVEFKIFLNVLLIQHPLHYLSQHVYQPVTMGPLILKQPVM